MKPRAATLIAIAFFSLAFALGAVMECQVGRLTRLAEAQEIHCR